jgi:hypothetical protein
VDEPKDLTLAAEPVGRRQLEATFRALTRYPSLTVAVIAGLLGLLLTMPLALHMGDSIYGTPGDATGTVAVFWWWGFSLQHGKPLLDNTMLGVPAGSGWEQVSFGVMQVSVFVPLTLLVGPVVAYNLGVLSSYPLTAWTTFLLGRRLGMTVLAAAFSALAFGFMPYHTEKAMGHLMQTHMEVFPAFLVFALRWAQGGSWWNLAGAGAIAGLTLWTDFYFAYILVAEALAFFAVNAVLKVNLRSSRWHHLRDQLLGLIGVGAVAALFVPPALLLAHRPGSGSYSSSVAGEISIFHRTLDAVAVYSARPREYLLPWHANPLVPDWIRQLEISHLHMSNFSEQSLFIGYTVIVLAAAGVILARRPFPIVLALAIGFAGFVMAQPPMPRYGPIALIGPSYFLNPLLPVFRVYARFGILVLFGAALLAGLGFGVLQARLGSGRGRWVLAIPFLLAALEFNNVPPTHTYMIFPAPAEYQWLRDQPPGILVEYPLATGPELTQEIQSRQYMLYQQVHLHPMLNGAPPTSAAGSVAAHLEPYSAPGVADQLRTLGIRYVFVHRGDYLAAGQQVPRAVNGLAYIRSFNDTDVFLTSGGP